MLTFFVSAAIVPGRSSGEANASDKSNWRGSSGGPLSPASQFSSARAEHDSLIASPGASGTEISACAPFTSPTGQHTGTRTTCGGGKTSPLASRLASAGRAVTNVPS
ncbi:hypothetical protein D3C73_1059050 [compost metagenome]